MNWKSELRFCVSSNPVSVVLEMCNDEYVWQSSRLEIRLNACSQSNIIQKQFIIIDHHWLLPTYCLSVFDHFHHFVGWMLKGVKAQNLTLSKTKFGWRQNISELMHFVESWKHVSPWLNFHIRTKLSNACNWTSFLTFKLLSPTIFAEFHLNISLKHLGNVSSTWKYPLKWHRYLISIWLDNLSLHKQTCFDNIKKINKMPFVCINKYISTDIMES